VNMYMDRDIDDRMSRTRLRPIPSGRMQPREVLAFGVLLSTTATVSSTTRRKTPERRAQNKARNPVSLLIWLGSCAPVLVFSKPPYCTITR